LVEGLLGVLGWFARGLGAGTRRLRTVPGFSATGVVAVSVIVLFGLVPRVSTGGRPPASPRPTDLRQARRTEVDPATGPATADTRMPQVPATGASAQRSAYARVGVPGPAGGEAFVEVEPSQP